MSSIRQLAAEYDTIATAAQHDRWVALIRDTALTPTQADAVVASEAFGPLTAELRRAEADHHPVHTLVPRLVTLRGLGDADDIAAVLLARLTRATDLQGTGSARTRPQPRRIAGLIPEALGPMDPEMQNALTERQTLIQQRAGTLAAHAITANERWVRELGPQPNDPRAAAEWRAQVGTVAAYRDRYDITGPTALGAAPTSTAQHRDKLIAATAIAAARSRHELTTTATRTLTTMGRSIERPGLRR